MCSRCVKPMRLILERRLNTAAAREIVPCNGCVADTATTAASCKTESRPTKACKILDTLLGTENVVYHLRPIDTCPLDAVPASTEVEGPEDGSDEKACRRRDGEDAILENG